MTVVPPVETAPLPMSLASLESNSIASQNLFEHSALNANTLPHGASPADLGRAIVDNLKGFAERAGKFASGTESVSHPDQSATSQSFASNAPGSEANAARTLDSDAGRLVDALVKAFDHAIESGMVVRSLTQFTSTAMTLTKGQ